MSEVEVRGDRYLVRQGNDELTTVIQIPREACELKVDTPQWDNAIRNAICASLMDFFRQFPWGAGLHTSHVVIPEAFTNAMTIPRSQVVDQNGMVDGYAMKTLFETAVAGATAHLRANPPAPRPKPVPEPEVANYRGGMLKGLPGHRKIETGEQVIAKIPVACRVIGCEEGNIVFSYFVEVMEGVSPRAFEQFSVKPTELVPVVNP